MKELSTNETTSIRGGIAAMTPMPGGSNLDQRHGHGQHIQHATNPVKVTTSNTIAPINIDSFNGDGALVFIIEGKNDTIIL